MSAVSMPNSPKPAGDRAEILEPGDHLTRGEFERRYDRMPEVKKAELIEGVVWMGSPVRFDLHARQHADLIGWLFGYRSETPGVHVADNSTLVLDDRNIPQPDAALVIDPAGGGNTRVNQSGHLEGAPELVAEIASSSVSFDLHAKKEIYRKFGVREYLVWRVLDEQIDWFTLREGAYTSLPRHADGCLESQQFPGLRLIPEALVHFDGTTLWRVLREGLASPAHAAFVQRLQGLTP